ncbi:GNAT family N-acetyltransferase [Alphaproteobacteria bacterium]|jgi:GNAT superfamily N-acetyltransferase|nr:GNAT family N-acetyltransferase [Alphaproteobacteria bacterium]
MSLSTTTLYIRSADPKDAIFLPPLLQQLGYEIDSASLAQYIAAYLGIKGHHAFIAVSKDMANDMILGFISLHISYWFHRSDPPARISALVVDEQYRGRGVGQMLVNHAEDVARTAGCTLLELTAAAHRREIGTHEFYKSLGFVDSSQVATLFRKQLNL